MRVSVPIVLVAITLWATLAVAEPEFVLRYPGGVPQVSITGEYPFSTYTIWRAPAAGGAFERITDASILCLGSCYAADATARPGASYAYRFDLVLADQSRASFGPYVATISPALARPLGVFAFPNPGDGATIIQLHRAGALGERPVSAEASIYDLTGRRVFVLHRGTLARGLTTVGWDGRDQTGARLRPGVYLIRLSAAGETATTRLLRR